MFEMRFVDPKFAETSNSRSKFPFVRSNCIFDYSEYAINLCPAIHYLKKNSIEFCTLTHNNQIATTDVVVKREQTEAEIKHFCENCMFKSK